MDEKTQYIKFMSDIIDSGIWASLSSSARALYPVLLKFSNKDFKPVWPSTETLMRLTGFKSKKSIIQAKKELSDTGLLHFVPGSGRSPSYYYFSFAYKGSKIPPQGYTENHPRDSAFSTSGVAGFPADRGAAVSPNNINITISNNHTLQKEKGFVGEESTPTAETVIAEFGADLFLQAYRIAEEKGLKDNLSYIKGICKNLLHGGQLKNNQKHRGPSYAGTWKGFLDWAGSHLTKASVDLLKSVKIEAEGRTIFIQDQVSDFLANVIVKYFSDEISPSILVVFS